LHTGMQRNLYNSLLCFFFQFSLSLWLFLLASLQTRKQRTQGSIHKEREWV